VKQFEYGWRWPFSFDQTVYSFPCFVIVSRNGRNANCDVVAHCLRSYRNAVGESFSARLSQVLESRDFGKWPEPQIPNFWKTRFSGVVDYRPVTSSAGKAEIWLPSSTELYMDFLNHRFYRRHDFRDVKFFSVKVHQTIAEPKE
jgi:hypothetical protein